MSTRIAVIGAGMYAPVVFNALLQCQDRGKATLAAFAARTRKTVDAQSATYGVKGYTDWKAMLEEEDVDAVVVATPDHLHREMSMHAARMGKHVLVEKPMDVTVEGARAMAQAAEANGVLLQVDMHKRFDPYHQKCRQLIQDGKLGDIQYGFAWIEEAITLPRDSLAGWAAETSPAWIVGSHMTDLFLWLTGLRAVRVYATGQKGKLVGLGIDAHDSIQMAVEFEGGAHLTVHTSWVHPETFEAPINQGIRLVGSEGMMEIDSQDRGARGCFAEGGMATFNMGFLAERRGPGHRPIYTGYGIESIESFVDNVNHLRSGGRLSDLAGRYPCPEEGVAVTAVLAAAHRSLETGQAVMLSELP